MSGPRKVVVYVSLFLIVFVSVALDSIHHHEFGSVPNNTQPTSEMAGPVDPFLDSTVNSELTKLVLPCLPPTDPLELKAHLHGWPLSAIEYSAPFETCEEGALFALHHLPSWRVNWLWMSSSLCLYLAVSWLASLCLWQVFITSRATFSLRSVLAIMCIVAFELSLPEQSYLPEGVHPLIFRIEEITADFCGWVSTIACYLSAVIAFYPKFIYQESSSLLDLLRTRGCNEALVKPF